MLSLRVKDVVDELGKTTYKDVADHITDEVSKKISSFGKGKKGETVIIRFLFLS